MTESPLMDSSFVVPVFSPRDDPIACLNKAMAFLTAVASSRFPSTNNQLRTSSNPRNHATIQDGRVTVQQVHGRQGQSYSGTGYKSNATSSGGNNTSGQARVVKCYNCQDEEQLAFLADLGVPDGQAVQTIIPNTATFQTKDLDTYDSDCDDISNAQAVLMANISNYGSDVISEVPPSDTYLNDMENQSVHAMQDFEQTLAVDFIDNEIHSDSNIILYSQYLQETQQEKANKEQNNESITVELERYKERVKTFEQRLNIDLSSREKMIDSKMYDMIREKLALKEQVELHILNRLTDDFGKRFTPQQELSAEQAFWLRMSDPTSKPSDALPVKIKAPKELPKISLVNESLKKIKFHLAKFDNVVKIKTIPNARTEGEWGFEHAKAVFNNETIPFLKSLKDIFSVFDRDLLNEIMEVKTVFDQMDAAVQQSSVDKQCLEIAKKELLLENDRLLQQIIKEYCNLEAEFLKSQNAFNDLLKSHSQLEKYCISLECSIQLNQKKIQKRESCDNQNTLEIPEFFENNDLKAQLQDKVTTTCKLKNIIKSMRQNSKEENVNIDYGEIVTKNVELENKNEDLKVQLQDKVFVITSLKNNLRKIKGKDIVDIATHIPSATSIVPGMFKLDLEPLAPRLLQNREAHIDYLKYTQEQADILRGIVEQAKAKQPLDRLKCSTSKCGSKPTGNKRNDRISHTPSGNMKNKVEAQPRKVNKKNYFVEPICDDNVKHSMLNANSNLNCATCKTFTIVGNSCPLTRITSANVVPPKQATFHSIKTQKPELKVYSKKPKNVKNIGSSKKAKIVESKTANHSEPNPTWGSNATDIPSSSSLIMTGCPDCSLVSGLRMFKTHDREPLSAHELFAFRKNTCFIQNLEGVDLLSGSRDIHLYTISLDDMLRTSSIYLLSKASKTKSWLWHRRLSHLNFACALGKSKKSSHHPKSENTNQEKLYLLHMDLYSPMRMASINEKRYILGIVDDYSRFTWVRFLRTKDEAPEAIIKCIKNIQVRLNATVRNVRTDNGTEFVNQTLHGFYKSAGISHQISVARIPRQNGIIERRN
ncbi:retrovirus-related pol polyprotein from transposon TNT 1-94 [Tanacetum coccineum]